MEANNLSLIEANHINEMQENLSRRLAEANDVDRPRVDSIRSVVLRAVVGEDYERAEKEVEHYVSSRPEFPNFQTRAERHVSHCADLIRAIQTKRNFPGLGSLSLSKQQEIHEKVLEHFEELKSNLKHIESLERDHLLTDIRSTVWVVQTASVTVFAVLAAAFLVDLSTGLLSSAVFVAELVLDDLSSMLVSLF